MENRLKVLRAERDWSQQDREHEQRVAQAHDDRVREFSAQATKPSVQLSR